MQQVFTVKISCDNAAFTDEHSDTVTAESAAPELARILRDMADAIEGGERFFLNSKTIRDINGNDVGRYVLKPL